MLLYLEANTVSYKTSTEKSKVLYMNTKYNLELIILSKNYMSYEMNIFVYFQSL